MLIPGIAEVYVPPRLRLSLAILMCVVLTPIVGRDVGLPPKQPLSFFFELGQEIAIGLFLGFMCRILLLSLETAGSIIAMQSSLSNAFSINAQTSDQSMLPATFITAVAAMMIFATSLHHVMLRAIVESYTLFPVHNFITMAPQIPEAGIQVISQGFAIAMKIAAPFLIIGTVFYAVLGILNRLMPQMMIFFIAQPAQLALGFILIAATLSVSFRVFMDAEEDLISGLFYAPGSS